MADELIHIRFPNNYGRAWLELLESELSEHARICYVAMTSFGSESRAGKEAIRRRMGVKSISTVKAAQAELMTNGWISRIKMGGGKTPTEWDVFQKPFDGQLPLLGSETPRRTATEALSALPPAVERPTVGRTAAPKQEDKQELKQEKPIGKGKHPAEKAFWDFAQITFKATTGQALSWPRAAGFQKQITEGLTAHGVEELTKRWDNYLADPYAQSRSLLGFFYDLDKWITRRTKLPTGGNNARAFVQPKTDWQPSGKTAPR